MSSHPFPRLGRCLWFSLLLAAAFPLARADGDTNPPSLLQSPASLSLREGQYAYFEAVARGASPLSFQWYKDGTAVADAYQSYLLLRGVTTNSSGAFTVVITNTYGAVTSSVATLTVMPFIPRIVVAARYQTNAAGRLVVPVDLVAQGDEVSVGGSLAFAPAVLSQAEVTAGPGITNGLLTIDTTQLAEGRLGWQGQVALPTNTPAVVRLMEISFELAAGASPAQAALAWTNLPVAFAATGAGGTNLPLDSAVIPQVTPAPGPMSFDRQSGLFRQLITVVHPGRDSVPGVRVQVTGLTNDLNQRPIFLRNGWLQNDGSSQIELGPFAGGGILDLTAEYYVSDRRTQPTPVYTVSVGQPTLPPTSGVLLSVDRALFTNEMFLVEFTTVTNYPYYVQYTADLTDTNTPWRTAQPSVIGNGGRVQWLDNGPPKTESWPTSATNRFYRVLRVQ